MAQGRTRVEAIDALVELESLNWNYEAAGDDEVKLRCPVHDDRTASASLNVEKNLWRCHACKATGDIVTLIGHITQQLRPIVITALAERYPELAGQKHIDPAVVEKYHAQVNLAGPLLARLKRKGVTDDMIRRARLGYWDKRITIPVFDASGRCVNVRRYLPDGPPDQKMRNTRGFGHPPALYRAGDLSRHDRVWVCGGEIKALVVGSMLEEHGVGAVSATAGEGSWEHLWTKLFKDKDIWVCMDVDAHGMSAAMTICRRLYPAAHAVHLIRLPLDVKRHPKGDVNDWVADGATAESMLRLMEETPVWEPEEKKSELPREAIDVALEGACASDNIGRRLSFKAIVAAVEDTPYYVPRAVRVFCNRDQPGCPSCPVSAVEPELEGYAEMTISSSSPAMLAGIGAKSPVAGERSGSTKRGVVMTGLCIPPCKVVEFTVRSYHVAHVTHLMPQLNITGQRTSDAWHPAVIVAPTVEMNTPYKMLGSTHPHPRDQKATLLVDDVAQAEDTLLSFEPSQDQLEQLRAFNPKEWTKESLTERLEGLYEDIEANVTWIFQRRDMHLALDLAWHSPLLMEFDGRVVNGWINLLVLGDSSQGKSEATTRLMEHYGTGDRVDCKNATVAGLVGGMEQLGNRWFVRWGAIPMHDRALCVLEEVKGASTEVLAKMTDMRSSGIAELPKIERRRTHARTRLVWISNPRSGRPVDGHNFGVEAVYDLIGSPEDVRRFDLAMVLSQKDVDAAEVQRLSHSRPSVEHRYTTELCRRLILWAWTRRSDQIHFDDDAQDKVLEVATALCGKYTETMVPLIDKGTTKHKVARLSAALAARTFSADDDLQSLVVRRCHVEHVHGFIDALYSHSTMGYDAFSHARDLTERIKDPRAIVKQLKKVKHSEDFRCMLLARNEISSSDIQDVCETDRDGAQTILSLLVRKQALHRVSRWNYAKNPQFIELLRGLKLEDAVADNEGEEF